MLLIIICKGSKRNHLLEKCNFIHIGNWGDVELINHQRYHQSLESIRCYWLGFDSNLRIGQYSGRNGKRT